MTSPLHRSGFRWFFAGRLVSLLGSSMAPVALAFAVLDASHRPGDLGIVLAARMVPLLAFLLVGGAIADRRSRRAVLLAASLGAGVTQGTVAAVLLTGHYQLAVVAAVECANGILDAFTSPALRGVVPQLVERDQLRQANALLGSTRNATKIIGPSIAGLIVVVAGSGWAIAIDAASYLLAAAFLARVDLSGTVAGRASSMLADIRAGWTTFRSIRWVWASTLSFALMNLVQTGTWQILGPSLTQQTSGTATWGFVLSARGVGLLVMSALLYRVVVRRFLALGQWASALGAVPLIALGAHLGAPWLIAAGFVAGLGSSVSGISWDTSLQEHIPAASLSRVASYDDLLSYIAIPVGQLAVGPLASAYGGFTVVTVAGLAYAAVAVLPLAFASVRTLRHGEAVEGGDVSTVLAV